jgi:Protein of unknown function (DUF3096)
MTIGVAHLQPIVSLIAGILILIMPQLLNYIVAIFLIVSGILGLGLIHSEIAQQAAANTGAATPLGATAMQLYALFNAWGEGSADFSGIINMIRGKP